MARAHELLDDQQVRSATSAQPHGFVSLLGHSDTPPPPAPEPTRYEVVHSDLMPTSTSFEFVRRGQRCGDVGWGCFQADPKNTQPNGRMEWVALLFACLLRTRVAPLPKSIPHAYCSHPQVKVSQLNPLHVAMKPPAAMKPAYLHNL